MKICVAGQGAFGQKHLDALKRIPGVEVTSLVGGNQDATAEVAKKYGVPHHTGDLSEGIKRADAVILTTPTKMHFRQGEQVAGCGWRLRRVIDRRALRCTPAAMSRFCSTLSCSNTDAVWNVRPIPRRTIMCDFIVSRSWFRNMASPVPCTSPVRASTRVVLPAPFGPMRKCSRPLQQA